MQFGHQTVQRLYGRRICQQTWHICPAAGSPAARAGRAIAGNCQYSVTHRREVSFSRRRLPGTGTVQQVYV